MDEYLTLYSFLARGPLSRGLYLLFGGIRDGMWCGLPISAMRDHALAVSAKAAHQFKRLRDALGSKSFMMKRNWQ